MQIKETTFKVITKPNSSKNEITSFDEGRKAYRISIKAAPDAGKANAELIRFLSKHIGKKVEIISGKTSKEKLIRVK